MNIGASSIHCTRLKEQILTCIPELESYSKGQEIWFAYKENVGAALATTFTYNDALIFVKADEI